MASDRPIHEIGLMQALEFGEQLTGLLIVSIDLYESFHIGRTSRLLDGRVGG